FPIGMWMFRAAPEALMKGLFGVGVAVLAAVELAQLVRAEQPPQPEHVSRPPTRRGLARTVALIGAGIAQGAWMTGGPLVVYAAGHELDDKHAFRATLCALWLSSQLLLATSYLLAGDMTLETLSLSGLLVVAVPLGLALGEWAYGTLSQKTFRTLVFVGLFVAGVLLSRSLVGYLDIFSVL
ncbi:MAG: sulfite exporter TauE/SafE family protein, partial [Myxococcota bacterium]